MHLSGYYDTLEVPLRKLAFLTSFAVAVLLFACQFAAAQQGDVFIGGGSLVSSSSSNGSFPSESGGLYLNLGGDVVLHNRFGFNVETAWRATQGAFDDTGLNYRPILTDFNLLFQPKLGAHAGLDLMGGIGVGATRFYVPGPSSPGYANYASQDHFMEHLGAGIRYYVWKHVFVRPEIHYYHVQSNNSVNVNGSYSFNTDNLFRVGASVGYTFGGD
jgi:opacity protein-like surface antigen